MTTTEEGTDMTRGPRPGDLPAGATWDDGRCDERTSPAPLAYLSPVVEEVARLRVEVEQVTAHRDHLGVMIRRLSDFLDGRSINSWKHGACWAAEDAIKSLTARAEAAEGERDALRAQVAAVEAKRDEFAGLVARALPAIAALGAAEEVGDRWYGYGHGPNNIHPGESLPCGVCDLLREFRAALATTGEGK